MSDVHAAAERYVAADFNETKPMYLDGLIVCRAYLALHPADDGDAIDIAFVQSLDLPSFAGRGYVVNEHLSIFNSRSGWHLVAGINGADDSDDSFNVAKLATRGQLRRLLAEIR